MIGRHRLEAARRLALLTLAGLASASVGLAQPAAPAAPLPAPLAVRRIADPRSGTDPVAAISRPVEATEATQPKPAAPAQRPLAPMPVTQLEDRLREELLESGRTFSLRLTDPVPVRDLLILLVRDTRFSIVAAPGVEGSFVGELKDVTLKQALDLVLGPLGLDYSVDGTFIRVFPRQMETRRFDVNYVLTSRTTRRVSGSAQAGLPGGAAIEVAALDHGDLFDELAAGVRTLLSPNGRFNLDRKAALLQVTDYPERLDQVRLYVEAVEMRATRQVALQAWVVEVQLDPRFAAGIDWSAIGGPGGEVGVTRADARSLIAALGAQGKVNVLASPRVVAMNNEPAVMRVTRQEVRFVAASQDRAPSAATSVPHTLTEGVVLSVTPQIAADGIVQMSLAPSVTERDQEVTPRVGEVGPALNVREADTFVRVREGETAVISGLLRQRNAAKTDLVILLTPTVVAPGAPPAAGSDGAEGVKR